MDEVKERNAHLINAYDEYLRIRSQEILFEKPIPYDWFEFPNKAPLSFMSYCQMLRDYPSELANEINSLSRSI